MKVNDGMIKSDKVKTPYRFNVGKNEFFKNKNRTPQK